MPAANMLGLPGEGFKIAMTALDGGRINIGACSLGGAGGRGACLLDEGHSFCMLQRMCIKLSSTRNAFGGIVCGCVREVIYV